MTTPAIPTTTKSTLWQWTLVVLGALLVLAAGGLQLVISRFHSSTSVAMSADKLTTTTVTGPAAPPTGLVTTVFAAGAVLILAGAFFGRISKIVIPGVGELDLEAQKTIAGKAAAATDDPEKAKALVDKTFDNMAASLNARLMGRPSSAAIDRAFAAAEEEVG